MTIIRLGITNISVTKPPFLEWTGGFWRCWTAYNPSVTSGTYIELQSNGQMERVTIQNEIEMDRVLL